MKTLSLLVILTCALLAVSGCNRSSAEPVHAEPEVAAVFKAGYGLKVAPTASAFIGLQVAEFSGRLPAAARLRTVQGNFVYVQNGEWLLRTPVTLGSGDGVSFEVQDGLYEGDRIVTGGVRSLWLAELHFLRAGQACAHGH
jgi:hypothetical protein